MSSSSPVNAPDSKALPSNLSSSEGLSLPLTIVSFLESAHTRNHLASTDEISVHVVGSKDTEVIGSHRYEEVRRRS